MNSSDTPAVRNASCASVSASHFPCLHRGCSAEQPRPCCLAYGVPKFKRRSLLERYVAPSLMIWPQKVVHGLTSSTAWDAVLAWPLPHLRAGCSPICPVNVSSFRRLPSRVLSTRSRRQTSPWLSQCFSERPRSASGQKAARGRSFAWQSCAASSARYGRHPERLRPLLEVSGPYALFRRTLPVRSVPFELLGPLPSRGDSAR